MSAVLSRNEIDKAIRGEVGKKPVRGRGKTTQPARCRGRILARRREERTDDSLPLVVGIQSRGSLQSLGSFVVSLLLCEKVREKRFGICSCHRRSGALVASGPLGELQTVGAEDTAADVVLEREIRPVGGECLAPGLARSDAGVEARDIRRPACHGPSVGRRGACASAPTPARRTGTAGRPRCTSASRA